MLCVDVVAPVEGLNAGKMTIESFKLGTRILQLLALDDVDVVLALL